MTRAVTCAAFADAAEELALGFTPSPERDALVDHASGCAVCATLLHELTSVTDALLALAPEAEPPLGFEARVVASLPSGDAVASARRTRPWRWTAVAAAVAAAIAILLTVVVTDDGRDEVTVAATISGRDGALGRVELVSAPSPKVLVLLEDDSWSGVWVCELEDDDGTWVEVGRWQAADGAGGAWAAAIDRSLLDATRMRITSTSGAVIATSDPLRAPSS